MRRINVTKTFNLNLQEGVSKHFPVGSHNVEDDIANHWWVKIHCDNAPPLKGKPLSLADVMTPEKSAPVDDEDEDSGDEDNGDDTDTVETAAERRRRLRDEKKKKK